MTDKTARNQAALTLTKDETIIAAFDAVKESLLTDLLNATTPEAREQKFQEWSGVERARARLNEWAGSEDFRRKQENET